MRCDKCGRFMKLEMSTDDRYIIKRWFCYHTEEVKLIEEWEPLPDFVSYPQFLE